MTHTKEFYIIDTTVKDPASININDLLDHVMTCIPKIKEISLTLADGSCGRIIPNLRKLGMFSCEIPVKHISDDPNFINDLIECIKIYFKNKNEYIGCDIEVRGMIQKNGRVTIYNIS